MLKRMQKTCPKFNLDNPKIMGLGENVSSFQIWQFCLLVYMLNFWGGVQHISYNASQNHFQMFLGSVVRFFFVFWVDFFAWITIERQSWIPMSKQRMAFNTVLKAHGVGGVKPMG